MAEDAKQKAEGVTATSTPIDLKDLLEAVKGCLSKEPSRRPISAMAIAR